jgi:hypothetical protein
MPEAGDDAAMHRAVIQRRACVWALIFNGIKVSLRAKNGDIAFTHWLLLDSRVVDVPMVYNPTFVMLSFLKPLFFKSLKNELHFLGNAGA